MDIEKALQMARERNLDLVQVTAKVEPPVCKIMDYGKFVYQQEKRRKEAQKKTSSEMKNVRISYNISKHDLEIKAEQIKEFLGDGEKVRIEMRLIGRQKALTDFAKKKIEDFLNIISESAEFRVDRELKKEPRGLTVIISPIKK